MNEVKTVLSAYADAAEKALESYLPATNADYSDLVDAMRYSLLGGGKRIRACLCQEFCRICGGRPESALPFAGAVEMVHAYSLIHDDLPCMDDDNMRRGKPSCHVSFGEDTAMLAGDALQALAFSTALSADSEIIPPENIIKAASILADAAGYKGMCGGQILDLQTEGHGVEPEMLREVQECKTGAMIIAAALMGCCAGNATDEQMEAAREYAAAIGSVFQMVDDVLDVTADEALLGKPVGSDADNDKTTYVTVYGLHKTMEMAALLTEKAKNALEIFGSNAAFLQDLADYLLTRKN